MSNVVSSIAYTATVVSTVLGIGLLVAGTVCVLILARRFATSRQVPSRGPAETLDVFASIYRAVLACHEGAAVLSKRAGCDSLSQQ